MELQGTMAITNINNNVYEECRTVNDLALCTHDAFYQQEGAGFLSHM